MSHHPASTDVEELFDQLPPKTRVVLMRVARRISRGYAGSIELIVTKDGGIRFVHWHQTESGDTVLEELG